jgi:hypothetical protein
MYLMCSELAGSPRGGRPSRCPASGHAAFGRVLLLGPARCPHRLGFRGQPEHVELPQVLGAALPFRRGEDAVGVGLTLEAGEETGLSDGGLSGAGLS